MLMCSAVSLDSGEISSCNAGGGEYASPASVALRLRVDHGGVIGLFVPIYKKVQGRGRSGTLETKRCKNLRRTV